MILGQGSPAALTTLYVMPSSKASATVRVVAANRGGATTFRISLAVAGAADALEQYVVYDMPIEAYQALTSAPVSLAPTDEVRCSSFGGQVSFTVQGIET